MNIKELARDIKDIIEDGCVYLAIYKTGRQWNYETLDFHNDDNYETDEEYIKAYEIDNKAIIVNGFVSNFGKCTLKDIEYRIKDNYSDGTGNYNLSFDIKKLEKDTPMWILIYADEDSETGEIASVQTGVIDYKFKDRDPRKFTSYNKFYNHNNELIAIEDHDTFIYEKEVYFISFENGIITFEDYYDGSIIKGVLDEENLCFKVEYVA